VALRDESGAVTGHLGTVTDISDRKRAEEELARHASLLRAVHDASPDGICLVDLRGDVLLSNTALDHLLPWDRVPDASLHERTEAIAELTTDPSAFRAASAALGGNPVTQVPDEFELAPSGAVLQRHTRPVTLEGAPEAVFGRLFLFRDVTAERRAERAKDEFIALASHELRTPLTSIQGYVELLQETEDEPLGDRQRRHLAVVMRNARRLSLLVDDLLTVARADAGRLGLAVSDLDLGELVRDCVQASGPAALERGILLEGSQPPARGRGDRARLGQVLDNLVSNALKFTPPGGRIVVSARAEDGGNVLEVTDTGIGISADDQSRLFERFYRTSGAVAAAVPGTGLGLSISKMIVEAHGGLMEVHSTEGEGSTFRVVLPS
jgi:signal transduction histidine kinase